VMREVQRKESLIKEARVAAPSRNGALLRRIGSIRPRIEATRATLATVRKKQLSYLEDVAVRQLEVQKSRIRDYVVEARYSLAILYDKANAANPPGSGRQ